MAQNPSPSRLDEREILQRAFQETDDNLRVTGNSGGGAGSNYGGGGGGTCGGANTGGAGAPGVIVVEEFYQ